MNTRDLYAILAAGVNQPDLILQWQNQPEFLEQKGLSPGSLDLGALWKFSGLAVKVRHNGLRPDFPLSFRVMKACGLEISLFSSYATFCSATRQKYASSPLQRARDLVEYYKDWPNPEPVAHSLLWDMLRHELALLELRNVQDAASVPSCGQTRRTAIAGSAVPVLRGQLILHELKHDPADVASALDRRPFDVHSVPEGIHYFAYRRTRDESSIEVLQIDAFAFYTLGLCTGKHTLSEISTRFGKGPRLSASFKEAIRELVANEMIAMRSPDQEK